jgi:hypothetical protein
MKFIAAVMAVLTVIYFLPAFMQGSHEINGKSRETAYRSAIKAKRYLSTDDRVVFDTAFGILDKIKSEEGPEAFASSVDGMEPEEVIELAKHEVDAKIASGHPDFKQYVSWEDMVGKLTSTASKKHPGQAQAPLRQSERTGRPN